MVKKYQEIKQEQFITELMVDAVVQGFVLMEEPFNNHHAKQLADLSLALFLQQRIDRINEGHYLTEEQFFNSIAKSKTQRATPSPNMDLTASATPSPKCPSDTSPSPDIKRNLKN